MNIFILSKSTRKAAKYHCDKHVVKMILELAQMLCTCHRFLDGILVVVKSEKSKRLKKTYKLKDERDTIFYKSTHLNHPCNVWLRESDSNYKWTYKLFKNLCKEYTYRYEKIHKCEKLFMNLFKVLPQNIPKGSRTEFAQAMPDYCKTPSSVESYRIYYNNEKKDMCKWKKRDPPYWFKTVSNEK